MYAELITLDGESVTTYFAIVECVELGETDNVQVPSKENDS